MRLKAFTVLSVIILLMLACTNAVDAREPSSPRVAGSCRTRVDVEGPAYCRPAELIVSYENESPRWMQPLVDALLCGSTPSNSIGKGGERSIRSIRLAADLSVEDALHVLEPLGPYLKAEEDRVAHLHHFPPDPSFEDQWGLHNTGQEIRGNAGTPDADMDAPEAWEVETGVGDPVTVAVLDSGVDLDHAELRERLWENTDEVASNDVDDDDNGFVDDVNGYNWAGVSQYNFKYWMRDHWEYSYLLLGRNAESQKVAQSFVARAREGHFQRISHLGVALSKSGSPTEEVMVSIREELDGPILGSYVVEPQQVSEDVIRQVYRPVEPPLELTAGNTYYIQLETANSSNFDFYKLYDNLGSAMGTFHTFREGQEYLWTGDHWDPDTGLRDDLYFLTNDYYYNHDNNGHGTHCGGIIAAESNDEGVVGVAFGDNVRLMPLKVADCSGGSYLSDTIDAVYYAIDNGADVVSMSFGSETPSELLQEAIDEAHAAGVVLLSSTGNSGGDTLQYPAGCENVIGVGATTGNDERALFSTCNRTVDVSAPGKDIYSTMPGHTTGLNDLGYAQGYSFMSGTSMACPMAAGLAALVRCDRPGYTPEQVQAAIELNSEDLGDAGRDDSFGSGRINACRTLRNLERPRIDSIRPDPCEAGGEVTVEGEGFAFRRGDSRVLFNGVEVDEYLSWTAHAITCRVPEGAESGPVRVSTYAGASDGFEFTVGEEVLPGPPPDPPPEPVPDPKPGPDRPPASTWYLAEGSTSWGFSTYISITNPNEEDVTARVTYMTPEGPVSGETLTLPAMSQTTVNPLHELGETDFSTRIECTEGKRIAADRTMSWTGENAPSPDGHCSVGVNAPSTNWYLPEGSSRWGFETWLLVQNPQGQDAEVTITYMVEEGDPVQAVETVPASSRRSFSMGEQAGEVDASIEVESRLPVICERSMYRDSRREGHDSIGTTTPAPSCYLAEGTTDWGFTTYLLVQNPNDTSTDVTITYMTPEGPLPHPIDPLTMEPSSRKTVRVNDYLEGTDFSTRVTASRPVMCERAMYWGADTPLGEACHDSIGLPSPHTTFYLPDGETSRGRETWTLVANPNGTPVDVRVTYLTPTGEGNVVMNDSIDAESRRTYDLARHVDGRASIMVECLTPGKRIMCERAMYWNSRGAGTDTIGGYSH